MMLIFKKASHGNLVTVELELNTVVDILKYRISKDMDKYVLLARSRVFFYIIWINCQRMCIRHINKGYYSRPGFSEEQLRICVSIINYDITEKKGKNSVYGKIHKGFDKLYACLGWS